MAARFAAVVFTLLFSGTLAYTQIGFIVKKGDEGLVKLVEHVLSQTGGISDSYSSLDIRVLTEIIEIDNAASYHRAFCRLISQGIKALLSPATEPHNAILVGYTSEYRIPFITTEMPEISTGLSSPYAVGIQPFTGRAMLGLFQYHGWKDVVYLYDHEYGTEKLHFIFLLGYRVLGLNLDGILKVKTAEEAVSYLQMLDNFHNDKRFHVVLDTDPNLARDIIWRHVNDIHVQKTNFHFVLAQPTPENFWKTERTAFASTNVTTFTFANHLTERAKSSLENWINESGYEFNVLSYYYYDATLVVQQLLTRVMRYEYRLVNATAKANCLDPSPTPIFNSNSLSRAIKEIIVTNGITGKLVFRDSLRINDALNITEITSRGYYHIGTWSDGMLRMHILDGRDVPITLPLIQDLLKNATLRIVTVISPPYMMLKKTENVTLRGNNRFEGYLKDIIELISTDLSLQYEIRVVDDYGDYDTAAGKWTGAIGEIIHGTADLVAADLVISGVRQRVVDFTDPYEVIGFSLVMKNPLTIEPSSFFYFTAAFTLKVWICIIVSIILFGTLFHVITKYTGAPDSIESASGIWGRKHAVVLNAWFAIGSAMFQSTGIYPRSISSRVLSVVFWFFTLILSALFIASITSQLVTSKSVGGSNPQLAQLNDLSLESIILESITRGWPKVGIVYPSTTANFIKKSKLPIFVMLADYLEKKSDVKVGTIDEGLKRVRESGGNYILLLESLSSEYAIHRKPCDIIATHDSVYYAGYGFASRLGSPVLKSISNTINNIQSRGILGSLHRKWWIDSSECKSPTENVSKEKTVHVFTGLICITAIGFVISFVVFSIQYFRKNKNKESRRQQLSFQDMNLDQSFPQPPPELLAEPAPVLNLPEYERKTLL